MKRKFQLFVIVISALCVPAIGFSQATVGSDKTVSTREQLKALYNKDIQQGKLDVEYIEFEDNVYSRSKHTEVGDQVELDASFRYQYSNETYSRFRFITDPEENTLTNETSRFEILLHHRRGPWTFQLDLELDTNNGDEGSTAIGPDLDSVGSFISYEFDNQISITFFPYNFDGVVGDEFNTYDVTRIFYISGSPNAVTNNQANDEVLLQKSIPGIVVSVVPTKNLSLYAGFGLASYLYPINPDFDLENNRTANAWQRKEDFGYKFGALFQTKSMFAKFEHVGHDEPGETGSFLKSASSLYGNFSHRQFIFASEVTRSQAGPYAFRIEGDWFEDDTAPFAPAYSDRFGEKHDWLGKTDYAYMLKAGMGINEVVPFVSYKYQGDKFVYRERDSAHLLRTFDDSQSHGGLHRFAFGAHFYNGKYQIKPQIEYFQANRPVFANSGDVREDRFNAQLKKTDYLVSILLRYSFGEYRQFRPY